MRPRFRLLNYELIRQILDEAFHLLETKGTNLDHDGLLARFADLGCRTDKATKSVWFQPDLIERSLRSAPREVRLWNIAGTGCCDLSGDNVHFTPGSTAIKVLDFETQRMRPAITADMVAYGKVVEQLEPLDYSATAITPSDVPKPISDSVRLYALLKTTSKPICTGAFSVEGFDVMTELQLAVRGTRQALREKPFALYSCAPNSPLKWSYAVADNAMKAAELGVPVEFVSMPLAGLVAPVSVLGCVIQHTAETLSGIVISQTTAPGAPIIYGGSPGIFDMRSMAPLYLRSRGADDRLRIRRDRQASGASDTGLHRNERQQGPRRPSRLRERHGPLPRRAGRHQQRQWARHALLRELPVAREDRLRRRALPNGPPAGGGHRGPR